MRCPHCREQMWIDHGPTELARKFRANQALEVRRCICGYEQLVEVHGVDETLVEEYDRKPVQPPITWLSAVIQGEMA